MSLPSLFKLQKIKPIYLVFIDVAPWHIIKPIPKEHKQFVTFRFKYDYHERIATAIRILCELRDVGDYYYSFIP